MQRWGGGNYGQDASARLSGRLLRLFALDADRLLAVTMVGDQVAFTILDASLRVLSTTAPPPQNSRLLNLSTRGDCHTGDNVLIPGFVIAGTSTKRLLVRAVGPGLGDYGVAGFLANPTMTLKRSVDGTYVDVATNDDWETNANAATLATVAKQLGAFALNTGSKDAALLLDLDPGQYTVVASGLNGGTGVGLVELYDGDSATDDSHLVNISTRGFVGVGGNIMIPGFVVSSESPKTLLIRGVGPALANFGVARVLGDPTLKVYRQESNGSSTLILTNDDWSADPNAPSTATTAAKVNAFPLAPDSKDAALVTTLGPGQYTVQCSGTNNSTGVGLVEVYEVPEE